MELLGNKELIITQDSLKYARIIAAKIKDENQRKRAYASIVALDVFSDELFRQGFRVNINKNLFKIAPVNEEFEITDIYCNGWKLDVRIATDDYVLIPKSHFKYDIAPDFYVIIKMDKKLKKAVLIGFVAQEDVSKTKSVDDYYVVDFSLLKDYGELLDKIKLANETKPENISHDNFREAYLSFLDGSIDYVRKKDMIKHLRDCEECRADFVEFFDFETIVSKSKNFPAIFDDYTLDFVGGVAVENPKYEGKEQVVQIKEVSDASPNGQIVSDLFNAAIETGLATDIVAAATVSGVTSAALSGISSSVNNLEDVLDSQDLRQDSKEEQNETSDDEKQEETFIEFYDGETEDTIEPEEDIVLNLDDEEPLVEGIAVEEDDATSEETETIDVDSDEILDSDLDSILEDDDSVNSLELQEDDVIADNQDLEKDDDLSFMEIDEHAVFEQENDNVDETFQDVQEGLNTGDTDKSDDTSLDDSFIDANFTSPDDAIIIGNVSEGLAIPDIVIPEDTSWDENAFNNEQENDFEDFFSETNQDNAQEDNLIPIGDDEEDGIQFIGSISDIGASDSSENEKKDVDYDFNMEMTPPDNDEDEIQFIDTIHDVKLSVEDEKKEEETTPDIVEEQDNQNSSPENNDEDEIEFINDKPDAETDEESDMSYDDSGQKQKYQEMFDYGESPVVINNAANQEVVNNENKVEFANIASSSFKEAMDISDEDEIEALYTNSDNIKSINISQIQQESQNVQDVSVNTNRLIVLASIIAGSLLVVSIVGFLMFSNISKHKSEQFNEQVNKVDSLDMNSGDAQNPQPEAPIQDYSQQPPPDASDLNVTSTTPKDMNKTMTNVFDQNASSVTVTKISWEVAKPVAQNPQIARYLQVAGKNIVINLKKNLVNATEFSYNDSAKVFIVLGKDNNIKTLKIITSSGSEQIDEIVLQSIKETLTYINVPVLADSVQKDLGQNAYTYKLVINF